jgi:Tfp pilus assembly protein PilF
MLQAIAKDPNYADAHFNLAVILITTQPSSRELAKEHYARATALGTQPSASLERLLQ